MRRCSAARASRRTTFRNLAETQPRFGPDLAEMSPRFALQAPPLGKGAAGPLHAIHLG